MALVPFEMVNKMNDLSALKVPNEAQVVKNMNEMTNVLADDSLTDNQKMNRFNKELNDYTVFAEKVVSEKMPVQPPQQQQHEERNEDMFNAIPKSFQNNANVLMRELKKYPNIIQWNPVNHEVMVKGTALRGSNIIDLISHVMRSRKTAKVPIHGDTFLKTLADLNVPEEIIKNKHQISKFRSYKQGSSAAAIDDEEDGFYQRQLAKARKQLAGRKIHIPTKTYNWNDVYK